MKTYKIKTDSYLEYCINEYPHLSHGLWNTHLVGDNPFYYKFIGYWYQNKRKGFTLRENKL